MLLGSMRFFFVHRQTNMAKKKPKVDNDASLNVYIARDLRDFLDLHLKPGIGSDREVIERLLRALKNFPVDQLRSMLNQPESTVTPWGDMLALNEWSVHTFTLRHWSWSIRCYQVMVEWSKNNRALQDFSRYREGYAWSEFANELRNSAIRLLAEGGTSRPKLNSLIPPVTSHELLGLALRTMDRANAINDEISQRVPFALYNLCCGFACKARFELEKHLVSSANIREKMATTAKVLLARTPSDGAGSTEEYSARILREWELLSFDWKDHLGEAWSEPSCNWFADRALDSMAKLLSTHFDDLVPWPNAEFFRLRALDDPELWLLRTPPFRARFLDLLGFSVDAMGESEVATWLRSAASDLLGI